VHHILTRRQLLRASAAAPLLAGIGTAVAQAEWPTRPAKVIVPYPAGGGADTVSRILFTRLSEAFGQQFVIDNRGGAPSGRRWRRRPSATATPLCTTPPPSR